jgi:hypothetical protein
MMNRQKAGRRPLLAIALLGGMALTAFAQSSRTNEAAYHGNCGAANGGGPNSTNYYSKGDPCAYAYSVPAERMEQLLRDNNFCSMASRTQVNCSQPVRGNYGQVQVDARNPVSTPQPSYRPPPSPIPPAYSTVGCNLVDLNNAVRRHPKDADALINRAVCYMSSGSNTQKPPLRNTEAAVKDLEAALRLAPRNFFAHHNYAHAAYLLGYDDFAVYEFNKAIALNPNSGRSYMGRGFAYLEECNFKAAPPDFQKAVSLDPTLRTKVASQHEIAYHHQQCTARPVPAPNFRAIPGTDPYLDHNSDYWRQRNWEERPH